MPFFSVKRIHISVYTYTASAPQSKDTGVFESFDRFIALRCYNYVIYLVCLYIIQYAETFMSHESMKNENA